MRDWDWLLWLFLGGCLVVIFAVLIPLNRWLTRRRRIASGWVAWCRTAATLPWADRWRLYLATATGRAVSDARLAPLAAQRASAVAALQRAGGPNSRWYLLVLAGVFFALALVTGLRGAGSAAAPVWAVMGLGYLYLGATVGAAGRSAEANRALAERNAAQ